MKRSQNAARIRVRAKRRLRRAGIPVARDATTRDLVRLTNLLRMAEREDPDGVQLVNDDTPDRVWEY